MQMKTVFTKRLSTIALGAMLAICVPDSAAAMPRNCGGCGMFGVARGQIARINATHIGDAGSRPIQVEMLFVDATGAVVARDSKTIAPGQAVFFDVAFEAVGGDGDRTELRVVISGEPERNLRSSVEVFDADTGKTNVFIGDPGL
jgi:hypothetical protein